MGGRAPSTPQVIIMFLPYSELWPMQFWSAPTRCAIEGYRAIDLEPWQLAIREQEGLAPYPVLVIISASADLDPVIATPAEGVGGSVMIITTAGQVQDDLEPLRTAGITVLEADGSALDLAHDR